MLIDIHVHMSDRTVPRSTGAFQPTPEEMVARMDHFGIDKAVCMARMSPECGFRYVTPEQVLECCARFPDRLIPLMNLDPRMLQHAPASDFRYLMQHYADAGCKGIGEYQTCLAFDDPLNINLFGQAGETGLFVTFHVAPEPRGYYGCYDALGLPFLENALKACPDTIFLGHSQPFWSEISTDVTHRTRRYYPEGKVTPGRVVELMRAYPNLHGDLSAGSGHNAISRDPEFGYAFLEEFQDRLYFGTDITSVDYEPPQIEYFARIKAEARVSDEAFEKITWRNAVRLLKLG